MPLRICPNCQVRLSSCDYYFCASCGEVLASNTTKSPEAPQRVILYESPGDKSAVLTPHIFASVKRASHILNVKKIVFSAALVLVAIGAFFVWYQRLTAVSNVNEASKKTAEDSVLTKIYDYADFVPFEADAYLLFSNHTEALPFLELMADRQLEVIEKIEVNKDKSVVLFLTYQDKLPVTTVLLSSTKDLSQSAKETILKDDKQLVEKVEDIIIISGSESAVKAVVEAKARTRKSLALNPKFVLMKNDIGSFGKITVLSLSNSGNIFLGNFTTMEGTPEKVKSVLRAFLKAGKGYFVKN